MWRPLHTKHRVHGLGLGGMHSTIRTPTDSWRSSSAASTRDTDGPIYESESVKQQHRLAHDRRIKRALRQKLKERSAPVYYQRNGLEDDNTGGREKVMYQPSPRKRARVTVCRPRADVKRQAKQFKKKSQLEESMSEESTDEDDAMNDGDSSSESDTSDYSCLSSDDELNSSAEETEPEEDEEEEEEENEEENEKDEENVAEDENKQKKRQRRNMHVEQDEPMDETDDDEERDDDLYLSKKYAKVNRLKTSSSELKKHKKQQHKYSLRDRGCGRSVGMVSRKSNSLNVDTEEDYPLGEGRGRRYRRYRSRRPRRSRRYRRYSRRARRYGRHRRRH